jgi:hypothetical protein
VKSRRVFGTEGQTLVQVALALTFLLAIVSVAIDVGHMYGERRRMQNAADAGALAGAREICFGDPALWQSSALDYSVNKNPPVDHTADASLSADGWTVTVTTTEQTTGWLATALVSLGLFDQDTVAVRAVAAAGCGSATSSCGLWPVVFNLERWNELYDNGNGCDKDFFLWVGDNPNNPTPPDCNTYWCDCFPDNHPNKPACFCSDTTGDGLCDCTDANGDGRCDQSDGDGVNDIFADEGRAYVDLSGALSPEFPDPEGCDQNGCGQNELSCWIANSSGAQISIGACLPDLSGGKVGVKNAVQSRIGDNINVPLYDDLACEAPSFPSDCSTGRTFHVSGFGCIRPEAYEQNYALPRRDGDNPAYKNNMIRVQVNCSGECESNCGGSGDDPPCEYCVRSVSLRK